MRSPADRLFSLAYPGRLIIIGRDPSGGHVVVAYAVTGRSPSSQARELVRRGTAVWTRPTDPEVLAKGNPDLLVYPALDLRGGIAVSNGKQTADIDPLSSPSPAGVLASGLRSWTYEPDEPIFTPRISGCVLVGGESGLNIIRRGPDGLAERTTFEFFPERGKGRMISTYDGPNANPLPVFRGEPIAVDLAETTARAVAEAVYASLGPEPGAPDLRVAVACLFARADDLAPAGLALVNRQERKNP
jgi:IMP cyclohydrolase